MYRASSVKTIMG